MSDTILPSVVGRLDDVVEAIRDGKWHVAKILLRKERKRRMVDIERDSLELEKRIDQRAEVAKILRQIENEHGLDELRKACGWKPEDERMKPPESCQFTGTMKPENAVPPKGERDSSKLDEQYERIVKHEAWLIGKEAAPKLDAAKLPVGAVMVLGGNEYKVVHYTRPEFIFFGRTGSNVWFRFDISEIQELIDRGVEFRVPKGGAH